MDYLLFILMLCMKLKAALLVYEMTILYTKRRVIVIVYETETTASVTHNHNDNSD